MKNPTSKSSLKKFLDGPFGGLMFRVVDVDEWRRFLTIEFVLGKRREVVAQENYIDWQKKTLPED